MFLLSAGPQFPNSSDLLSSERMAVLMHRLESLADMVVIDGPPVLASPDALVLGTQSDQVLLVIKSKYVNRNVAGRAVTLLEQVQAKISGVVLTDVSLNSRYFQYHNQDAYGYYYISQNIAKRRSGLHGSI